MTYKEAREFIDQSNQYGSKLGLAVITELLKRLDNPQDKLKVIHVAGTNGKGSTSAFLSSILACSGYRVGRYISPAVFSYFERIQITTDKEGRLTTDFIDEQGVAETIAEILPVCMAMVKDGFDHPTSFEIETAMAFLYLVHKQVEYAVVEVGLGGRLDATNVFTCPLCCVITSISMDHMQYLGTNLADITAQKAGIIKKHSYVVTGNSEPQVLQTINRVCTDQEAKLRLTNAGKVTEVDYSPEGTTFCYDDVKYKISLLGEYQIDNALLAIETINQLQELGHMITKTAVRDGLQKAGWSGRFEIISRTPYFLIDGAHNEDAALKLKKSLEIYFSDRKLIFILGVLADKDYHSILRITAPMAETIYTITPANNRALDSTQLAIEAKKYCNGMVVDAGTVEKAIRLAYEEAKDKDVILAFGSLSYLMEVTDALKYIPQHHCDIH